MASEKEIEAPMSENEKMYLLEENPEIAKKYDFGEEFSGNWIHFIAIDSMDIMWAQCCKMYRRDQFTGIKSIKSSTAKPIPRQCKPSHRTAAMGVIIFHCGPSHDEPSVMICGQNVVDKLDYFNMMGYISYKSDAQTAKGTRATGNQYNSLYRIPVPKSRISEAGRINSYYPKWSSGDVSTESLPSTVTEGYWLHERNPKAAEKYQCERAMSGRWDMKFNRDWLDKDWQKACKLYRQDKLTGVSSMRVSTAKQYKHGGIIICYCGPSDNPHLVKSYGENLAKLMNYCDCTGRMNYISYSSKKTLLHVEVPSPWRRRAVEDSD